MSDTTKSPDAFTKTRAEDVRSKEFGLDEDELDGIAGGKNKGDYQITQYEDKAREQ